MWIVGVPEQRCLLEYLYDRSSTVHCWTWGLQFPCRCMPDRVCSLHYPVRRTDSPLICCRSISCTLWCTYLSQLVPSLSFLPPRGQIVVLTVQQWSTYLSEHNTVEKSCLCSWMSDKNVELNYEKSYANCSCIHFFTLTWYAMFVVRIHPKTIIVKWEITSGNKKHLINTCCNRELCM